MTGKRQIGGHGDQEERLLKDGQVQRLAGILKVTTDSHKYISTFKA